MITLRQLTPAIEGATFLHSLFSMNESINIEALKQGDDAAFRDIVAMYQDRVYNTCLGFLPSRQEAEDTAQEVFIEVFRSIKNFRGEAALSTWIYRIAVTKSLLELRKKRRLKRFAYFVPWTHGADDPMDMVADPDAHNHPLAQLEDKERAETIYATLGSLPESQRVAFTLHKIEGLSYGEIAAILDTSVAAIESLIHRARTHLRKKLSDYYTRQLS
jgi:RNA polymerase sigma factor (sigma-70 family)